MRLKLQAINGQGSRKLICSLPLPPFQTTIKIPGASCIQAVPLGQWPQLSLLDDKQTWPWDKDHVKAPDILNPVPRRYLVQAEFTEAAPEQIEVELEPGPSAVLPESGSVAVETVPGREVYHHRDESTYHYVKREDYARVKLPDGTTFLVRLGMRVNGTSRYWQWVEVIPHWSGSLSAACTVGGHVYSGKEDRPLTMDEARQVEQLEFFNESTVGAKLFVRIDHDGLVSFEAHFANIQGYGRGSIALGRPFIEVISEGAPLPVMETENTGEGNIESDAVKWKWTPLDSTEIFLGMRHDTRFVPTAGMVKPDYVNNSATGLVEGAGCSFEFTAKCGNAEAPARYLAMPEWYRKCGEFGLALPEKAGNVFPQLAEISRLAESVFLRNSHKKGICRGGVYRYLDKDCSGRYEFSMDGNESLYIYRGAYMKTSTELYKLAFNSARFINDVCVDHYYFNVHYHGDSPEWNLFSLIYLRFGGLVQNWLETGNPCYLETAQAVAGRWIAVNRQNQPRKNMGRDTEPIEGIMTLYDATGITMYFSEAEKISMDVTRSLFSDNFWRSGFGVGPYWGTNGLNGTAWNGSHLFAGICEFLFRACPETCAGYEFLLQKACALARRIIKSIDEDYGGFHRTSGAYLPRRMFLIAHISGDKELMSEVTRIIHGIEADYRKTGDDFFKAGHHCAGYLDSPYVPRSLS